MGFSAMFTFQLDNTKRGKHCWHPIAVMGVDDTFRLILLVIQQQIFPVEFDNLRQRINAMNAIC